MAAARFHRLTLIAAAVGFYGFLSIFPALAAVVSIYGLRADPGRIDTQVGALSGLLPPEAQRLLRDELARIASGPRDDLNLGLFLGLGVALFSAQRGIRALCQALSIVRGEPERPGFFKRTALSLPLTAGAVLIGVLALGVVIKLPRLIARFAPDWMARWNWLSLVAWPILAGGMLLGLGVVYRWGTTRRLVRSPFITRGALLATTIWLATSWGFSFYLSHFGNYDHTYGSMAAIAMLLIWFYLSALAVLYGAELDCVRDTRAAAA